MVGAEKIFVQKDMMPLEASDDSKAVDRSHLSLPGAEVKDESFFLKKKAEGGTFVSAEDISPLAMNKIEGLKIKANTRLQDIGNSSGWGQVQLEGEKKDDEGTASKIAKVVGNVVGVGVTVAVGVGIVAWGLSSLLSGAEPEPEEDGKKMKRPGRDGYMYRADFERDPKNYFRGERALRKK